MLNKVKLICLVVIIYMITDILYVGLHEFGHCLIAILCGATITNISIINRSMSYTGGNFNPVTLALLHSAGIVLPVIIGLVLLYISKRAKLIYNLFVIIFCFNAILSAGALQAWVIMPLLSLYSTASANDDVIKFINILGIHPICVSVVTALCIIVFIALIIKRKYKIILRQLSEQL